MKKHILILLALSVMIFTAPLFADEYDFRKAKWGMSKEEVKHGESKEPISEGNNIFGYEDKVAGMECYIFYVFASNKLVRTRYYFIHKHSNRTDYINDYQSLQENLQKKYGQPIDDDRIWKNDLYKDDPSEWGMAVAIGHLIYQTQWTTDTTGILLHLSGDNYKIKLLIEYKSTQLHELEQKAKETETMDAL